MKPKNGITFTCCTQYSHSQLFLPVAFTRPVQTRKRLCDKGMFNSFLIQLTNFLGYGLGLCLQFLKLANKSRGVGLIVCF